MTDITPSPRGYWVPMRMEIIGVCGCDWQHREVAFEHADYGALSEAVQKQIHDHARRTGHGPRYVEKLESGWSQLTPGDEPPQGAMLEPSHAGG